MNLLIITQKVDENDDLLGFFISWLKEFSKKFDRIFVITLGKGQYNLPKNVEIYSLGKEKGRNRFARFFTFYFLLFKLVPKSSGIFAHMSPIFAVASWPAAFIFRKKIILWYLHRQVTFRLKLAEMLCYKIVTASKESLNLKSDKIIEVGHGIDINAFSSFKNWRKNQAIEPLKIISIGRISQIKNYETLIKAVEILRDKKITFDLKIIGRPIMKYDFEYFERLKQLVTETNLKKFVEFIGFIPYQNIRQFYQDADLLINLAPTGGIDKVVLEAMAASCLVLTSNLAFSKYFGPYSSKLIFEFKNPDALANKITSLESTSNEEIEKYLEFLRESVRREHDLKKLIDKLSSILS